MEKKSYQKNEDDLEQQLVDLVRVGLSGSSSGVRQLAKRLIRTPPLALADSPTFREKLGGLLLEASGSSPLREVATPLPVDVDSSLPLAVLEQPVPPVTPILAERESEALYNLLEERAKATFLHEKGLEASRTVLLSGPPGVGKTLIAKHVAFQLHLPLLTIDLASVMSSYLGRTGQNLRLALEDGKKRDCVVFLDEFDALAKRRDDDSDIGELKRLVNVLLLELERWPATTLLLAATNHPDLLDRAVRRRFDVIIELPLPDEEIRAEIFREHLRQVGHDLHEDEVRVVAVLSEGSSGSDISSSVSTAARRSMLNGGLFLKVLLANLPTTSRDIHDRDAVIRILKNRVGISNREIAGLIGVSHPTVARALKRAK
jgi:hypothetical protein